MFAWICPKCGQEVPPAYAECPNCAAGARPAEAPAGAPAPTPAAGPPAGAPPPQRSSSVSAPWWFLALTIAGTFLAVGMLVMLLQQRRTAAPPPQPSPSVALETPGPATAAASGELRDVELTGLRLTEDAQRKAFVRFVVVNHSGLGLGRLAATVHLKAVARQAQEPVGTFSFETTLGPYEAKDLQVPLETKLRVYELPDWQFLRAELQAK